MKKNKKIVKLIGIKLKLMNKKFGFTLVEIIIVATILVVFTTLAYVSYSQYIKNAENAKNQADLDTLQSTIELKKLQEESFPSKIE